MTRMSPDEALDKLEEWADNLFDDPTTPPPTIDTEGFQEHHRQRLAAIKHKVDTAIEQTERQLSEMPRPTRSALKPTVNPNSTLDITT